MNESAPQCIGIVGGAGPQAGVFLLERIFSLCQTLRGAHEDADFPKLMLLSFPFSDMLSPLANPVQVAMELSEVLRDLRGYGARVLAIACNTLHAFLSPADDRPDLVHLPRLTAAKIPPSDRPLVLCTSTSVQWALHKQSFPCTYPVASVQQQVDAVIHEALKGNLGHAKERLFEVLEAQTQNTIILGCTELSLLRVDATFHHKTIIDPLEAMAQEIVLRAYSNELSIY